MSYVKDMIFWKIQNENESWFKKLIFCLVLRVKLSDIYPIIGVKVSSAWSLICCSKTSIRVHSPTTCHKLDGWKNHPNYQWKIFHMDKNETKCWQVHTGAQPMP